MQRACRPKRFIIIPDEIIQYLEKVVKLGNNDLGLDIPRSHHFFDIRVFIKSRIFRSRGENLLQSMFTTLLQNFIDHAHYRRRIEAPREAGADRNVGMEAQPDRVPEQFMEIIAGFLVRPRKSPELKVYIDRPEF